MLPALRPLALRRPRCFSLCPSTYRSLSHSPSPTDDAQPELGFGVGLEGTPKPTIPQVRPSADADALACILIEHHNPFHAMESSLQLAGVGLSPELVMQTLLRLRGASKVALGFFLWARDHAHHRHRADAYELMVDILGRVHQLDVAWQLIIEMDQGGGGDRAGHTPRLFAVLIRRHVAAGLTRQAVRAFDDMEAFIGREADAEDFKMLLDTLCKYGYAKVATEIFNKRKFRFEPDVKAYTILIYGWCKVNQPEMAQRFLNEMIDRGLEPNVVTYNILLNGICRRANLHPDTRFNQTILDAEDLLAEMHKKGIDPDVTSYSIILHVYSRARKPELSVCMLRSMKEKGISPTVATYTSVIKCLASCGRMEEAEGLLDEMANNGVCPSPATYNCFFKEYRWRNDAGGSMKLYKKMREVGSFCKPDLRTYHILIGTFLRLDRMGAIRELWHDMVESGVGPDADSYTSLIHGLCEKQKWRKACQFFMEMIEKGFLPRKVTFETLYRGLIQSNKLRTWRRLKNKVEEEFLKFGAEFKHYHFKPYKR